MKKALVLLIVAGLLAAVVLAAGCGDSGPEVSGKYVGPGGVFIEFNDGGTCTIGVGKSSTKAKYTVEDSKVTVKNPKGEETLVLTIKGSNLEGGGLVLKKQ